MSAKPDMLFKMVVDVEAARAECVASEKAYHEAHKVCDAASDAQRHNRDALQLARHTLMYYAEHGEMPKPGTRYLDFVFPEA